MLTRNPKKKKKSNDLKIGASFDLMGPDIDSPEVDRDMRGNTQKIPADLDQRIKRMNKQLRPLLKKA